MSEQAPPVEGAPAGAAPASAARPPASAVAEAVLDFPAIAYCATLERAKTLIAEMIRDAAGRPLGLDIETTPTETETTRLKGLKRRLAAVKGKLKAAKKAKAPAADVEALAAESKLVEKRIEYVETAGLDPHRANIRLAQVYGGGPRVAVIDTFRTGSDALRLLDGLDVVAHNVGFELSFLEAAGVTLGAVNCTAQMARLTLGEHATRLKDVVEAHLDIALGKDEQRGDWGAPRLSSSQIAYAAGDVVMTFRLAEKILPTLGPQLPAYLIQLGAAVAAARMTNRGVLLDPAGHAALMEVCRTRAAAAREEFKAACAAVGLTKLAARAPETPAQKRAALKAILPADAFACWPPTKTSRNLKRDDPKFQLSTSQKHLRRAAEEYPPIRAMVKMAKVDTILNAFGPTLTARVSPVTGRIHAAYWIAGATSGRSRCSSPNVQQSPKDPAFRRLYRARPGYKFVDADYATMELRAFAQISGDARMAAAFADGVNFHKRTASRMTGLPIEEITDDLKSRAKAINFGVIYGSGAKGVAATAEDNYGVKMSEDEARCWIASFFSEYPRSGQWRSEHAEQCERDGRIVIGRDAARGAGRIVPLSRLKLEPGQSPFTRCCNLPIQGVCADCCMLVLARIDKALFDEGIEGGLVAFLHDEFILEVPENDAERAAALLEREMISAFEETFPGAPTNGLVKAHVGDNWIEAKGDDAGPDDDDSEDDDVAEDGDADGENRLFAGRCPPTAEEVAQAPRLPRKAGSPTVKTASFQKKEEAR